MTDEKHLCDSCKYEFPTCEARRIVFGIDRNSSLRGAEADKVLHCDCYTQGGPP